MASLFAKGDVEIDTGHAAKIGIFNLIFNDNSEV